MPTEESSGRNLVKRLIEAEIERGIGPVQEALKKMETNAPSRSVVMYMYSPLAKHKSPDYGISDFAGRDFQTNQPTFRAGGSKMLISVPNKPYFNPLITRRLEDYHVPNKSVVPGIDFQVDSKGPIVPPAPGIIHTSRPYNPKPQN